MFTVPADSSIATISELKRAPRKTLEASQWGPVYVTHDGKPVAAVVSLDMIDMINEAVEDRRLSRIAGERMEAISLNPKSLLGEDEFWGRVEARRSKR